MCVCVCASVHTWQQSEGKGRPNRLIRKPNHCVSSFTDQVGSVSGLKEGLCHNRCFESHTDGKNQVH